MICFKNKNYYHKLAHMHVTERRNVKRYCLRIAFRLLNLEIEKMQCVYWSIPQ